MVTKICLAGLALMLFIPLCRAEGNEPVQNVKSRESYSLGYEFGARIHRQGVEIDREVLISAITDGLSGKEAALTPQEMSETLKELRKKVMVSINRRADEGAARNLEKGKIFLYENRKKEGVVTLPSGLQYRVLREGNGPVPKEDDTVSVNYRGTLIDGTEFDNSRKRGEPAVIQVKGVIKGWSEALQRMKTGSRWQIFVPEELAYANRRFGRIPPRSTLIFELELVSIQEKGEEK